MLTSIYPQNSTIKKLHYTTHPQHRFLYALSLPLSNNKLNKFGQQSIFFGNRLQTSFYCRLPSFARCIKTDFHSQQQAYSQRSFYLGKMIRNHQKPCFNCGSKTKLQGRCFKSQFLGIQYGMKKTQQKNQRVKGQAISSVAGGSLQGFWLQNADTIKSSSFVRHKLDIEDPGLDQQLMSSGTNMSQFFDMHLWHYHRRVNRYFEHLFSVRQSIVLRRILKPCIILTMLSAVVYAFNYTMLNVLSKPNLVLAISPVVHQLLGAVLSLQLVFKTNSSYARFDEGRKLWSSLIRYSRDFIRIASCYLTLQCMVRLGSYLKVFCKVLKWELRQGERTQKEIKRTLQKHLPSDEAAYLLQQPNISYAIILQITRVLKEYQPSIPDYLKKRLEAYVGEMIQILTNCERIYHSPIPLSYTRHTTRSLMVWLATLPLALYPIFNWQMIPAIFIASYLFLGIDEIGVEIEEPFCILPLSPLCKIVKQDVDQAILARTEADQLEQSQTGVNVNCAMVSDHTAHQIDHRSILLSEDQIPKHVNGFQHDQFGKQ
eukprot:TRINITY_DN3057_c1_g1_i3.p1 TRINITY_DN3057_c1_g1~~TRINITY_DN3057_c1_g1_i3.p1  ORF type:complete len:542 (-),score=12.88 TRINITY_DN3057_c1_g1_i3:1910-3535(-)